MKARRTRARLRRILYLGRRPLAALCAFVAVLATLFALSPDRAPTVTVVAAGAGLTAGTVLAAEHLTTVDLPATTVPVGAAAAESEVVGRTLAGSVTAGSVLTTASVSAGERLARPGHVVASLPLPGDGIAALVRPGVRLDVLDASGAVLAADVPVVTTPDTPGGTSLDLGGGRGSALVEVPAEVASRLAAQASSSLTIVVR